MSVVNANWPRESAETESLRRPTKRGAPDVHDRMLTGGSAHVNWQTQSAVTIMADVTEGNLDALRSVLDEIAADVPGNRVMPLGKLDGTHFARFFVTDALESPGGTRIPAHLVFMSDFDGSADAHLEHLTNVGGDGMDELFGHCVAYPAARPVDRADRVAYLKRNVVAGGVRYVNTIGKTSRQIRAEAELYEAIEDFLDLKREQLKAKDARGARGAVIEFVSGEPSLRWALTPAPRPPLGYRLRETAHFAGPLVVALVLLPIALPALVVWLLVLRAHESGDPAPLVRPDAAHLAKLRSLEDHGAQNQFTALGFVKPGRFRAATASAVLQLIGFGARHIFNNGNLAGVKTIHFARWIPLDGGARIVFCSNYDGSTESYMDDFIDKVAWGLNATFSNAVGYPLTRWLIFRGANNEEAFKGFLRAHQLPTQVWYAAYPATTALNIRAHARVRAGLSGEVSEKEAQAWLRLL